MKDVLEAVLAKQGFRLFPESSGEKGNIFPLWKPGQWYFGVFSEELPHWEGGEFLGQYAGRYLFAFPFTLENLKSLREAFPGLSPEPPEGCRGIGIEEESPSFFPATFTALWENDIFPLSCALEEARLEEGILAAMWGAFASSRKGPFGALFMAGAGELLKRGLELGYSVLVFAAKVALQSDVFLWDERRLASRFSTLSPREREIWKRYTERRIRLSKDLTLHFSEEVFLRILLAYTPLLDALEEAFAELSGYHRPFAFGVALNDPPPEAHFFLAEELHRRGVDFRFLIFSRALPEHRVLAQVIEGYCPGVIAEDPTLVQHGWFPILKHPGFRILCELWAERDSEGMQKLFGTSSPSPLAYRDFRETCETFLFQCFEDVTLRIAAFFQRA